MAYSRERHIFNSASDWSKVEQKGAPYTDTTECKRVLVKARQWLKENVIKIRKEYPPDTTIAPSTNPKVKSKDPFVYVGAGGNAYLHWKLSRFYKLESDEDKSYEHLMHALEAVHTALMLLPKNVTEGGCAFYMGATGIYTLAAILYSQYKEPVKTEKYLNQLLSFLPAVLQSGTPDELLYGRAGYMFCLLLVRKYIIEDLCTKVKLNDALRKVFDVVISSGQSSSTHNRKRCLQYYFYGSDYLGSAHGTAGILYMLLQFPDWCKESTVQPWIVDTLDNLLSTQLPNGNFPSKLSGRKEGTLVHWCHGAPGIVSLLYRAYKVLGDKKFLLSMEQSLDCVWKYGILRKGYGLCHGIAGNAYAFLCLYRETRQDEYYYKALKMAECCWNESVHQVVSTYNDPQRFRVGEPDCPYSLMEGLAGAVCFFCDILHPEQAAFPGYDGELN